MPAFVNQLHSLQQIFLGAAGSLSLSDTRAPPATSPFLQNPPSFSPSLKGTRPENDVPAGRLFSMRSLDSQNPETLSRGGSGSLLSTSPNRGASRSARFFGWAGEKASLRRSGDISADEGDESNASRDLSGSLRGYSRGSSSWNSAPVPGSKGLSAHLDTNGRTKSERTLLKSPLQRDLSGGAVSDTEALSSGALLQASGEIREGAIQPSLSDTGPANGAEVAKPDLERFKTAKPDALEEASAAVLEQSERTQEGPDASLGIGTGTGSTGGQLTPLQRTWQRLQGSYAEVLREEVIRVLELEAENAVLLKSVAQLPKLRAEVHKLRAKLGIPRKVRQAFLSSLMKVWISQKTVLRTQ